MSEFEFFPGESPERVANEDQILAPSDIDAPAFRGLGHELWAAPARGAAKIVGALGLAAGAVNAPIDYVFGTELQDQAFANVERARKFRQELTLQPSEVGVVANVLGGFAEFGTTLALTGPVGAIASQELNTAADLAAEGVAPRTAVAAGATEAAGLAVGFRIPNLLGRTLAQRLTLGGFANLAQGVGTRAAVGAVLRSDNAPPDVSARYSAWDGEAAAVDFLAGMAFGGMAHYSARTAAAAVADYSHRLTASAPGEPISGNAIDVQGRVIDLAIDQALADQPVTATMPPGHFQEVGLRAGPAAPEVREGHIQALIDRHVPDIAEADAILPPESAATLRELYAGAVTNFEDFNRELRQLSKDTGARLVVGPIKLAGKASKKIAGDYANDATKIADLLRSTLEHKTLDGATKAIEAVTTRYPVVQERSRNWLDPSVPTVDGYRDAKFVIEFNGNLAEIQVNVPEMLEAKAGRGHELYNEREDIFKAAQLQGRANTLTELKEIRRLTREMQQHYGAAWEKFLARSKKKDRVTAAPPRRDSTGKGRPPSTSQAVMTSGPTPALTETGTPSTSQNIVSAPNDSIGANIGEASNASIEQDGRGAYSLKLSDAETEGLAGWRPRPGQQGVVYSIMHGGKPIGFVDLSIAQDGAARIEDIVADRGPRSVGAPGVRGLLRDLLKLHPEITSINGERVSGIRRGGRHGNAGTGVEVSIPMRSPGPDASTPGTLQGTDGTTANVLTERGLVVPVAYRIVDASALVTSHTDTLDTNPNFPPELQPRDRTRAASEQQITSIENQIRPELLGASVKASDGAPIVGADGIVESGNARSIALRRAYATGKAEGYKAWVREHAKDFGLGGVDVDGMRAPVLVRVAQGARDRAEFARQANESAIAAMSPVELAQADAQRLGSLEGLATNEDGTINLAQSRGVVDAFLRDVVSPADLNTTTTAEGGLSQAGLTRLRNAIFTRAYGDPELLGQLTEALDGNVRNILAGMVRAAPEVARLRDLQAEGARHEIPIFDDLAQAVEEFRAMRRDGVTMAQREAQGGLFGDDLPAPVRNLVIGLEENSRAPKRMAELISHMARTVDQAGDPRQSGLFDSLTPPDPGEIASAAVAKIRSQYEVKVSGDLFTSPTMAQAIELAASRPDMMVLAEDGTEIPASQALAAADAEIERAQSLRPGIDALAACALQQLNAA